MSHDLQEEAVMMGGVDLLQLAGQFGPMGLMVAYLIWRETRNERLARDQTAATKELAVALALLKAAVEGASAPGTRRAVR